MKVHLIDGTFELFRSFYGGPSIQDPKGREVGATRTFMRSLYRLLRTKGVSHVAVAFDHTIESFRNKLFEGYKTGEGIDPDLYAQFPLVEKAAKALGVVVWPMRRFEADDALATGSIKYRKNRSVSQVVICSPDKDLAQCVVGTRVVLWDRIRDIILDESGVRRKFGIRPASIPDWLALVGDSADGIPGVPRWGVKASSQVLSRYGHLEGIPRDESRWSVKIRGSHSLVDNLRNMEKEVKLYRTLATLRTDVPLKERLADLRWKGVSPRLKSFCESIGDKRFPSMVSG